MLEPHNRSKRLRRRQTSADQRPQTQYPIPFQRQNRQGNSGDSGNPTSYQIRQASHYSLSMNRPDDWAEPSRLARRNPADGPQRRSFNLRSLLSPNSSRSPMPGYQSGREGLSRSPNTSSRSVATPSRGVQTPLYPGSSGTSRAGARLDSTRSVTSISGYQKRGLARAAPVRSRGLDEASAQPERGNLTSFSQPLSQSTRTRQPKTRSHRPPSPLVHLVRLLILGVGIGAIAGTLLSVVDPAAHQAPGTSQAALPSINQPSPNGQHNPALGGLAALSTAVRLGKEIAPLKASVQELSSQYPDLTLGIFLVDLDNGTYLNFNGTSAFPAASTIKIPILVAFLQDVDAGKVRLNELLTMEDGDLAEGSGEMQDYPIGTQYTALETAFMMIAISDNTATNIIVRRLGGAEVLNERFRSWGLSQTVIRNPLADLEGTNTTTPQDLTSLLIRVSQGELLSLRSRDRLMEIMQATVANTLIPEGINDEQAVIAHKTGTIANMLGDAGIVDMPNGKRYVISILVKRPDHDDRAQELIRQVSATVYGYLSKPVGHQIPTALPSS